MIQEKVARDSMEGGKAKLPAEVIQKLGKGKLEEAFDQTSAN